MAATAIESLVGQEISGYRIERKLGQGGMGCVFRARQVALDRLVALKVLPATLSNDEDLIARFKTEAKAVAKLQHDHIVAVHDSGKLEGGLYFIAMEFCEGGSVAQLLKRQGPFKERDAIRIVREAASGLVAAARVGVIHRDMKPDNLLLAGPKDTVKIADFGLAKASDSGPGLTKTGAVMGTPAYMPPEQWEDSHSCDHRSDLYALGCSFYELLTGKPPFHGPSAPNFMTQHLSHPIPDVREVRPDVSEDTASAIALLMAKLPGDRYQDGTELVAALDALLPQAATTIPKVVRPSEKMKAASTTQFAPPSVPAPAPAPPVEAPKLDLGGKILLAVVAVLAVVGALMWARKNIHLGTPAVLDLRCEATLQGDSTVEVDGTSVEPLARVTIDGHDATIDAATPTHFHAELARNLVGGGQLVVEARSRKGHEVTKTVYLK